MMSVFLLKRHVVQALRSWKAAQAVALVSPVHAEKFAVRCKPYAMTNFCSTGQTCFVILDVPGHFRWMSGNDRLDQKIVC